MESWLVQEVQEVLVTGTHHQNQMWPHACALMQSFLLKPKWTALLSHLLCGGLLAFSLIALCMLALGPILSPIEDAILF